MGIMLPYPRLSTSKLRGPGDGDFRVLAFRLDGPMFQASMFGRSSRVLFRVG